MAAITAPAPTATSRSPVSNTMHLKPLPLPLHDIHDIHDISNIHDLPPLPSASTSGSHSPRMRQPPASPVRVSFHQDDWAQPANAHIEDYGLSSQPQPQSQSQSRMHLQPHLQNRALPRSSDAPTPPPHANSDNRLSRGTTSTEQQLSTESSAATSASSVDDSSLHNGMAAGAAGPAGQTANGAVINGRVPPTSNTTRRSSLPRPQSSYSVYSDLGGHSRSPGFGSPKRVSSAQSSRKSPDQRPASYADMLNVPYPQPGPAPMTLDNAQLRTNVGSNASLLSTPTTLDMYRQNVKKTNDMSIQYSFAVFLIATAQEQGLSLDEAVSSSANAKDKTSPERSATPLGLVREARSILQRLSNAGYPFAQYYLADGYASGLFSKGKEDYHAAFPLFVLAAKHGHAESAYRTALSYEFGWGCRKDPAKAVQYLRTAAAKRHPGAMTRLGKACLSGDLGEKRYREGIKWLKLATESADAIYNVAPYQLGCLYETGYGDDIFQDESYAAELFTQAAELGNADANYRMGDAYEHGRLNCPCDPALSVHFYTGAAERGHAAAMMGLCAWYMVGAEPLLEKDEEEAYEWARRSADLGHVKAQYTVGYFTEMGIGCRRDILEANLWYVRAADAGDERATQRLQAIRAAVNGGLGGSGGTPMEVGPPRTGAGQHGKIKKSAAKEENCAVM